MSFYEIYHLNPLYCDVHALARPVEFPESSLVCLSYAEIMNDSHHFPRFSAGIHPWWLDEFSETQLNELKAKLITLTLNPQMHAIGETGIDRLHKETVDKQIEFFHWHWKLAEERGLPLIIHKVRSGSDFLSLLKKKKPKIPWIFHDFHATYHEIHELMRLYPGCYFSFGKSLLKHDHIGEAVADIPVENLLIETDEESQSHLALYYKTVADFRKTTPEAIQSQVLRNFSKIFKIS